MIFLTAFGVVLLSAASQQPTAPPDGKALYLQNCATCHGAKGDGDGLVKFDKPARSFIDGGFSFGNTPTALFNTISKGIGGTPMPAFEMVLSKEEIEAVAASVLLFAPPEKKTDTLAAIMTVTNRPQIIRGGLKDYHDDSKVLPRVVILGGLDGLSVEINLETMGILAFRKGDFVQRDDWGDRGGAMLKPLGELLMLNDDNENGWGLFSASGSGETQLRFVATEVSDGQAKVIYRIIDAENNLEVAEVTEYFDLAKIRYADPQIESVIVQHISIEWLVECEASLFYGASYQAPAQVRVGRGLRLDPAEIKTPYSFIYEYVMLNEETVTEETVNEDASEEHNHD
ncbi:MAG: mono/diheme cytochrome c family protein [Myxococcota bacterium]|jgi:mono/diheme cytochrome c family protein